MKTIYLADDDAHIRKLVHIFLNSEGYLVEAFDNGDSLYAAFQEKPADLVILDIMMPGSSGLEICERIREDSKVPIILLTAKDSDLDLIAGITLGSDDYLTKPFRPTLLTMRVRALLRRVEMERSESHATPDLLHFGDLRLDIKGHVIRHLSERIPFTPTEFAVASYLLQHGNDAVSRDELLNEIWGYETDVETRVTDETMRRIRKKLKASGSAVQILNVWGFGYRISDEAFQKEDEEA